MRNWILIGALIAAIILIIWAPKEGFWGLPSPNRYDVGPLVAIGGGKVGVLQPPYGSRIVCINEGLNAKKVVVPNRDYVYNMGGSNWESCELCATPGICQDCPNIITPGGE